MRYLLLAAVALAIAQAAATAEDELPSDIKAYLASTAREAAIPLFDLKDKPDLGLVFGTFGTVLDVGDIGRAKKITVLQIIDDKSMRATVFWTAPAKWKIQGPLGTEYFQRTQFSEENVMIRNFQTRGMVDDASYEADTFLKVSRTETYTTALGGTKTVLVLEPIDLTPFADAFKAAAAERVANSDRVAMDATAKEMAYKQAEYEKQLTRTWVDSTGKFSTVGRLIEVNGSVARIRKTDGGIVELKLFQLSAADKKWIADKGMALLKHGNP